MHTQICRLFHTVIEGDASLQYTIELSVAGLDDGPNSPQGPADRLDLLRKQQSGWNNLDWTDFKIVPRPGGGLWELCGGVLAQSTNSGTLVFRQLPSHYRGITERQWEVDISDIPVRDFTMDPSQDLLVLVECPRLQTFTQNASMFVGIHLRTLSDRIGKPHPMAVPSGVIVHNADIRAGRLSFVIQVCGEHVAIHFVSSFLNSSAESQLCIWNWKNGKLKLALDRLKGGNFAFLDERHVLIGDTFASNGNLAQPRLIILDIERMPTPRVAVDEVDYVCSFRLPPFTRGTRAFDLPIRCDPSPVWKPNPENLFPFATARQHRLYVITMWLSNGIGIVSYDLLVPSETFLSRIHRVSLEMGPQNFTWDEWGPMGSRLILSPVRSNVWVCYVFGTKYVSLQLPADDDAEHPPNSCIIEVWDFNQLALKRDMSAGRYTDDGYVGENTSDTNRSWFFAKDVCTSLPFRVSTRNLSAVFPTGRFEEAMCSEDSIILVDSVARKFGILTF
ncbi:hypothetical protein BJ138DRAFT_1178386 [Hygrophoropsis aurantiaca]|uniref:Uncharacterized protein n=1 Tax=Hygrophoropsis aurantiaca TaxID=72124 RepID=A0ACB8AIA7_9AGAM|nr:hypothetical protein BJ138DRAFT_1178386 [Hygrophoropsis aurantiaca]